MFESEFTMPFPALVEGDPLISVVKENGVYTFKFSLSGIADLPSGSDVSGLQTVVIDPNGTQSRFDLLSLIGALLGRVQIGNVTTGPIGGAASAAFRATLNGLVLDLVLPQGPQGNGVQGPLTTIGTALKPVFQNAVETICTATAGSPYVTITAGIPAGHVVNDYVGANDTATGSFLTAPGLGQTTPHVIGIVGNVVQLSVNANASGSFPLRFGQSHFDSYSTTLTNTVGGNNGLFGLAAKGKSNWVGLYWSGLEYGELSTVFAISPNGTNAGVFASRASDNTTNVDTSPIPFSALLIMDDGVTPLPREGWVAYEEARLTGNVSRVHLREMSIQNFWPEVLTHSPYNMDPLGLAVYLRGSAGVGFNAAPYQTDITSWGDMAYNGKRFKNGIVVGADAMDIYTAGRNAGILLMSHKHALQWFAPDASIQWEFVYDGGPDPTAANGQPKKQLLMHPTYGEITAPWIFRSDLKLTKIQANPYADEATAKANGVGQGGVWMDNNGFLRIQRN